MTRIILAAVLALCAASAAADAPVTCQFGEGAYSLGAMIALGRGDTGPLRFNSSDLINRLFLVCIAINGGPGQPAQVGVWRLCHLDQGAGGCPGQ